MLILSNKYVVFYTSVNFPLPHFPVKERMGEGSIGYFHVNMFKMAIKSLHILIYLDHLLQSLSDHTSA